MDITNQRVSNNMFVWEVGSPISNSLNSSFLTTPSVIMSVLKRPWMKTKQTYEE